MVNCPKCGFSQPDDQYCAQCGVDMVMYRARRASSGARLFSSAKFQVSALVAVAILGGFYVHSVNKSTAERLITDTPIVHDADEQESTLATAQAEMNDDRSQMNETNAASLGSPVVNASAATAKQSEPASAAPNAVSPATAPAAPATAAGLAPTAPAVGLRNALQPAQAIRVSFIEAQTSFLQDLLADSQQSAIDGPASWGVVQNLEQRLSASRDWHSLAQPPAKPIALNKRSLFFSTMADQTAGLTVQVIPLSRDEAGTRVQVDANRTLRDPATASSVDSYNFRMPDSFTLPKGSALIITGVLPHRPLSDGELQLYRNLSVMKSMTSESFRNGATDVAVIVEAR